ncbi:cytochrome c oxidase subunit 3 family protein [Terasakiella sp. A23]|uniref:cytochrome c oxidase subunit 3 family protein n=1 Tax=Terasakiella sp. FCG-A23 TaxID=3080561 RepID=UPI002953DB61|nr:cytochrome c oxidase subunit 3 family protein [Terasakiella sp. A23]MDV7339156.1 cytochrome c oxidase subunit 3 family protein [Terasakiella sp. A23]
MKDVVMEEKAGWGALDNLPGNPMMWILIISELLVFGAFFVGFAVNQVLEPDVFMESQNKLDRFMGGINTLILITSGYLAALATHAVQQGDIKKTRACLLGAMAFGVMFGIVKFVEYGDKAAQGINIETNDFFTLFYLMTGFHFLHVIFGLVLLGIAVAKPKPQTLETVCAFWHMVDLIWVLLFPLVYLVH